MLNLCTTLLFSDPYRTHFNFRDVSCEVINPRLNMAFQILVIQVSVYIAVVPKAIFCDSDKYRSDYTAIQEYKTFLAIERQLNRGCRYLIDQLPTPPYHPMFEFSFVTRY